MEIERPEPILKMSPDAKLVHKGVVFDVYQWQQEMFDGSIKTFEKLKRDDTVIIVPVLDDGNILLIEDEQPGRKSMLTIPGGRIDDGEDVITAAKRELLEETGYEAESYELWHAVQPLQKIDWAIYTLIAKGLKKVGEQNLDGGEKITLKRSSLQEFFDYATRPDHGDKWVMSKVFEAMLDPQKMEELKKLLSPKK